MSFIGLLAASAGAALSAMAKTFAVGRSSSVATQQGRHVGVWREALNWQQRLDKALLDVNANPSARLRNLRKALEDPAVVLQDVSRAVNAVATKGFKDGHVEAIDTLWPQGTTARRDLESIQALRKQVPEVIEDLQNLNPSDVPNRRPSSVNVEGLATGLLQLATDPTKQKELVEEARNSLRRKPRGLETPSYSIVRKLPLDGAAGGFVEVRRYKPFTVARRAMADLNGQGFTSSGEGFTTLAGYLFGKNSDAVAMEMTSPVEISYNGGDAAVMSFVLPKAFSDAPPEPEEAGIEVVQVPERLVVVKEFPGVATKGEVERQRAALAELVAANPDLQQINASEYSVLQYNPPYTLPWRRLNELAVVVEAVEATSGGQSEPTGEEEDSGELGAGVEAVAAVGAVADVAAMAAEEAAAAPEPAAQNPTASSLDTEPDGNSGSPA